MYRPCVTGLWDEFVDRLLASRALWRLVDEVADSPAVTAAITQQGLGFADQRQARRSARSVPCSAQESQSPLCSSSAAGPERSSRRSHGRAAP